MKRILFLTDFSQNAENAIMYGMWLYRYHSCKFILLHSFQIPYSSTEAALSLSTISRENAEREFENFLGKVNREFPRHDFDIQTKFEVGDLESLVTKMVKDKKIDMVIMGTQGATGITAVLIGSNTSGVVNTARCPVLVVPGESEYKIPRKIVLAVDVRDKPVEEGNIMPLLEITRKYNSHIYLLYVAEKQELALKAMEEFRLGNLFTGTIHSFHTITDKNISKGIDYFVQKHDIDMVAMTKSRLTLFQDLFHRSMTRKMTLHTKTPLLVMIQPGKK